jgi:hypothetical protein
MLLMLLVRVHAGVGDLNVKTGGNPTTARNEINQIEGESRIDEWLPMQDSNLQTLGSH